MLRKEIKNLIKKAILEAQKEKKLPKFDVPEIEVEYPEEKNYGDYATNIAMQISRNLKTPLQRKITPIEIADILTTKLKSYKIGKNYFEKIELAGPGFINFFLSKEFLQKQVVNILDQGDKFGYLKNSKNKKVNVEFISANPTGQLHIGNGRGAFFGDTLANVLEKAGFKVEREYFVNDAKKSTQIKELGKTALGRGKTYLNDYLESRINNYESRIKEFDNEAEAGFFLASIIKDDIRNFVENKLKIKFDKWFSEEQELYESNEIDMTFQWLKKKNLVYKKEGAWWLKTSEFGDEKDWVIVRSSGEPTYLLSDIAYHKNKFKRKYDKIIDIWGADHQGHVNKIKAVAKILGYKGEMDILISQMVQLKSKIKNLPQPIPATPSRKRITLQKSKISKRTGGATSLEGLADEVGLDVVRFMYLMKSLDTQMEFDLDLAREQSEKNPVYYVQYVSARIHGIFENTKFKIKNEKRQLKIKNLKLLQQPSELNLIRELIKFPEIIEDVAKEYEIQRLPYYAMDIATAFHKFYKNCQVLSRNRDLTEARLALTLAVKTVLKDTLNLMGVSAPDEM